MYIVSESVNDTKIASYEIDSQAKAISFANRLMWEWLDRYGRIDGDLDNVCDTYQTANENNMSASTAIENNRWVAHITKAKTSTPTTSAY